MTKQFSDSALLSLGWRHALDKLGFFVLLFFVLLGITAVPMVIFGITIDDYPVVAWIAYVAYIIISLIMGVGVIKISLNIVDGIEPSMKDLFIHGNRVFSFVGTSILYVIIVYVGLFLFIVPGCIWMTKFYLAPYYAVDKGLNPIEALRASSQATMGVKWDVFAFYILTQIVTMLGFLAILVGSFVAIPTTLIALAAMYRILDGGKVKIK